MEIAKHTVTSLTYALRIDGELIEKNDNDNPLTFLAGVGMMIPGFERQLMGKKPGDNYDIMIQPEEGYGEVDPEAIIDLSKDVFKVNGQLQEDLLYEGNVIPLQDQEGHPLHGTVVEIGEDKVKMDFNHKLAGKTLHFIGEILEVRQATPDEINHGHVHGPGGHHH